MEVYAYRPDRLGFDWRRKGSFELRARVEVYMPDGTKVFTEFKPGETPQYHVQFGSWWSRLKFNFGNSQLKQILVLVYGDDDLPVLRLHEIDWNESVEIIIYLPEQEDGYVIGYRGHFHDLNDRLSLDRQVGPPPDGSIAIYPRAV